MATASRGAPQPGHVAAGGEHAKKDGPAAQAQPTRPRPTTTSSAKSTPVKSPDIKKHRSEVPNDKPPLVRSLSGDLRAAAPTTPSVNPKLEAAATPTCTPTSASTPAGDHEKHVSRPIRIISVSFVLRCQVWSMAMSKGCHAEPWTVLGPLQDLLRAGSPESGQDVASASPSPAPAGLAKRRSVTATTLEMGAGSDVNSLDVHESEIFNKPLWAYLYDGLCAASDVDFKTFVPQLRHWVEHQAASGAIKRVDPDLEKSLVKHTEFSAFVDNLQLQLNQQDREATALARRLDATAEVIIKARAQEGKPPGNLEAWKASKMSSALSFRDATKNDLETRQNQLFAHELGMIKSAWNAFIFHEKSQTWPAAPPVDLDYDADLAAEALEVLQISDEVEQEVGTLHVVHSCLGCAPTTSDLRERRGA